MGLLEAVREDLSAVSCHWPFRMLKRHARTARNAVAQLDDYILPRYRSLDAPLLAVVGGSTGAGKSTLVNALVGHPVTRSGAIRPTTRQPILLHHPADAGWFEGQRVLPTLSRIRGHHLNRTAPRQPGRSATPDAEAISSLVLVADPGGSAGHSAAGRTRTSTPSRMTTAGWRASCSPPRTSGSSSPQPTATQTRSLEAAPGCGLAGHHGGRGAGPGAAGGGSRGQRRSAGTAAAGRPWKRGALYRAGGGPRRSGHAAAATRWSRCAAGCRNWQPMRQGGPRLPAGR